MRSVCIGVLATLLVIAGVAQAPAQGRGGQSFGGSVPGSEDVVSGIAWFGVLKDGLKEAKRTGKPIMFLTAAPQCDGIPGMW